MIYFGRLLKECSGLGAGCGLASHCLQCGNSCSGAHKGWRQAQLTQAICPSTKSKWPSKHWRFLFLHPYYIPCWIRPRAMVKLPATHGTLSKGSSALMPSGVALLKTPTLFHTILKNQHAIVDAIGKLADWAEVWKTTMVLLSRVPFGKRLRPLMRVAASSANALASS